MIWWKYGVESKKRPREEWKNLEKLEGLLGWEAISPPPNHHPRETEDEPPAEIEGFYFPSLFPVF